MPHDFSNIKGLWVIKGYLIESLAQQQEQIEGVWLAEENFKKGLLIVGTISLSLPLRKLFPDILGLVAECVALLE